MRKVKLYLAISLNGKIAKADGSVEWLDAIPNPEESDYGYFDFYKTIDTTIQGKTTYDQIMGWGIEFPYADNNNYVFTSQHDLENTEHVEFVSENHIKFVKELKQLPGKDIWLVGGGKLNTTFLNAGLIDEINVHVMPIILTEGIDLFGALPDESNLKLIESKSYFSGVVELRYAVN